VVCGLAGAGRLGVLSLDLLFLVDLSRWMVEWILVWRVTVA
jgi:hypothetical protein